MTLRRPPAGPTLLAGLAGRLHPRRLRRRLPAAVAVAAVVALVPVVARGAPPADGRAVLLAARDLPPGHVVGADDLRPARAPTDVVPPGAVEAVPEGTVVRSPIGTGEIVVAERLGGGDGVPGRLAPDERAVTLPWPVARPPVAVGQAVDLQGTTAPEQAGPARTVLLAAGARVLAVDDDGVTVAVPAVVVADVHRSLAMGVVDLAITPFQP